jgi:hypothetical protein
MAALGFAVAILSESAALGAEIICVSTYGKVNTTSDVKNFPSGRAPTPTTCLEALIKGKINAGDAEKFAVFVIANHPFLDRVYLWSSGGLVDEALKIGRLVRKALLFTEAPRGPHGGRRRSASHAISRLESDALHRPGLSLRECVLPDLGGRY